MDPSKPISLKRTLHLSNRPKPSSAQNTQCNQKECYMKLQSYFPPSKNRKNICIQRNNSAVLNHRSRFFKPKCWDNVDTSELNRTRDPFMPRGFQFYEQLVKKSTNESIRDWYHYEMKNNVMTKVLFTDLYKIRMNKSDIFNLKSKEQGIKIDNKLLLKKAKFIIANKSDIFNLSNDKLFLDKGKLSNFRKKVIVNNKANVFCKESLEVGKRKYGPSLINHSGCEFHILNPSIINISSTKRQIFDRYKDACKIMNNSLIKECCNEL